MFLKYSDYKLWKERMKIFSPEKDKSNDLSSEAAFSLKRPSISSATEVIVNNTVKRVWRDRVEGLVAAGSELAATEKVEQWRDDMEATLLNVNVRKRLVKMNTRNDALRLVGGGLGRYGPHVFGIGCGEIEAIEVLDVGGVYDPSNDRYDHHQKEFEEIFGHGFSTKLSSVGLVYKHFGKEIIAKELQVDEGHPDVLRLFVVVYKSFMETNLNIKWAIEMDSMDVMRKIAKFEKDEEERPWEYFVTDLTVPNIKLVK
ncbi:hypothetical protein QYF36_014293 [Acer negundo]|nr:hypothetical protein QYF36_014293 [Acer negundo]